jgi:tetratricopeptide (TPR) repeat protein
MALALVAATILIADPVLAQVRGRGASGKTRVEGTVVDSEGNPLQGVLIKLEEQTTHTKNTQTKSNKKGKFTHSLVAFGDYKFYFEKEGYKLYYLEVVNKASDETDLGSFGPVRFSLAYQDHRTLKLAPSGICVITLKMATEEKYEELAMEAAKSGAMDDVEGADKVTRRRHPAEVGAELFELKNYQGALDNFMKALAEDDGAEDPNLYFAIGRCQFELKQFDQALQSFQRVEELSKEPRPGLFFYQAQIVARQGRTREAVALLQKELQASETENPAVLAILGSLYRDLGENEDAIRWLEKAVTLDPANLNAILTLGTLHASLGHEAESERYFQMAVDAGASAGQEGAVVFFNLGALNYNQGELRSAAEAYERAIALRPSYATAHRELGYTYWDLQEKAKAREHFEKYLELQPKAADRAEIETLIRVAQASG